MSITLPDDQRHTLAKAGSVISRLLSGHDVALEEIGDLEAVSTVVQSIHASRAEANLVALWPAEAPPTIAFVEIDYAMGDIGEHMTASLTFYPVESSEPVRARLTAEMGRCFVGIGRHISASVGDQQWTEFGESLAVHLEKLADLENISSCMVAIGPTGAHVCYPDGIDEALGHGISPVTLLRTLCELERVASRGVDEIKESIDEVLVIHASTLAPAIAAVMHEDDMGDILSPQALDLGASAMARDQAVASRRMDRHRPR